MVCKICGNEIKEHAKFCADCGAKVETRIEEEKGISVDVTEAASIEEDPSPGVIAATENTGLSETDDEEKSTEPQAVSEKESKIWSPAIIGVTAVFIAAILVGATYAGGIRTRNYDTMSFEVPVYESESSQGETETAGGEA